MDFFYSYETGPGKFSLKVVDAGGKIIWQSIHPAFITDSLTGQLIPDDTPMDLGIMKNLDDVAGLERHLKNSMLLNLDDILSIEIFVDGGLVDSNELKDRIKYISEKSRILLQKSLNTNSWYGATKDGVQIRISDHPSKFVEKTERRGDQAIDLNLEYYHPDAIVHLISGRDPFAGYKEGDTITHAYDKVGDVTYLKSDYKKGFVEVKTKDGRIVEYDMNKFLGADYKDKTEKENNENQKESGEIKENHYKGFKGSEASFESGGSTDDYSGEERIFREGDVAKPTRSKISRQKQLAKGGIISDDDKKQIKKLQDINAYLKKYISENEKNPFDLRVKDFKKQVKVNNRLIKEIKGKYSEKESVVKHNAIIDGNLKDVSIISINSKGAYVEYSEGTTEYVPKARIENFDELLTNAIPKKAKGGKLTPAKKEKLIKAVAKQYEGKKVKPEYQSKYGKRYSKKEAKSVAYAIANTVEKMKKENKSPVKKNKYSNLLPGF